MERELSIFALGDSKEFGEKLCGGLGISLSKCDEYSFPNGESYIRILENVRGKDVIVISSLYHDKNLSVDQKVWRLGLFNDAAKLSSAGRIINVVPYMAYCRQDRLTKSREALSAKVLARFLESTGCNRLISLDWHSYAVQNAYDIPLDILPVIHLLVDKIAEFLKNDTHVVALAPDVGASKTRIKDFARILQKRIGKDVYMAVTDKSRKTGEEIESRFLIGDVDGADVVICDDETATGTSLINAADKAKEKGARNIYACVSHCNLNEKGIEKIENSIITKLITTDSIHINSNLKSNKIICIPCYNLLGEAVIRINKNLSVSSLFQGIK